MTTTQAAPRTQDAESAVTALDPTVAAEAVDLSEYAFEGAFADLSADTGYFEYTAAADPIGAGYTTQVPIRSFPRALYEDAPTGIIPLDLSDILEIKRGPATSPALMASFIRIRAGESVEAAPNATSQLYYVLEGRGVAELGATTIEWEKGDFITLPARTTVNHRAASDAVMYFVHDEPLLRYLGAEATEARFSPTKFPRAKNVEELEKVATAPGAESRNRISVLLANAAAPQTLTITHVLWAMFGLLPAGAQQRPHRHQSVALDLILDALPGCYSLLGTEVDATGAIVDPIRVDWEAGGAFVTPPGMWHAHFNDSGAPAHLIPIQDAGLHTYLRSLDIRFTRSVQASS